MRPGHVVASLISAACGAGRAATATAREERTNEDFMFVCPGTMRFKKPLVIREILLWRFEGVMVSELAEGCKEALISYFLRDAILRPYSPRLQSAICDVGMEHQCDISLHEHYAA